MLLLIIFALLTAIGVVMMKRDNEVCTCVGIILATISGAVVLLCGIYLAVLNVESDAAFEKMKAKHDALMTADKGDIVTLTKDIAEYNGEVKAGRKLQKSIWVGLYQYDWWDDLDTIEIESLVKEGNYGHNN